MKVPMVLLASLLLLASPLAVLQASAGETNPPPGRVEKVPVYIEVPIETVRQVVREVPVYIEVPVETVKTVEVVKETGTEPCRLSDWESEAELLDFLDADDTDSTVILQADSGGMVNLQDQCEDFALQLRDRAMAQGKYLSVIALHPEEYLKWYGEKRKDYHAICMARIGNDLYYVEPATDRAWLALHLD